MNVKKIFTSKSENSLAFFNILGPVILNGINFFTVPIFTRMLGTTNFGLYSIYLTWVQVFIILVGIQTGGTIATARMQFDDEEHKAYNSSVLSLSILAFIFVSAVVLIFIKPISSFTRLSCQIIILMLLQSFGTYAINFASLKFIYSKEASKNLFVSMTVVILSVILSIILIWMIPTYSDRYIGRIWGIALPNIAVGSVLIIILLADGKIFFSKKYWKFCLPLCVPLIFHGLSQIVLGQADRVMLQQLQSDNSAVGIYSFNSTFSNVLVTIWCALNNTWVPFYYDYVKANDLKSIKHRSSNYMFLFTIITMGFILLCPEVIKIFAPKDFWAGIYLMPVMCASSYMIFLYSFPVNFEFYHRRAIHIAVGTCSAAAINIIANALLIPRFGMMGAALATLLAYFLLFVFHHIICKYAIWQHYHYRFEFFMPGILSVAAVSVVFYLTMDMWYIRWLLAAVLGVIMLRRLIRNHSIF